MYSSHRYYICAFVAIILGGNFWCQSWAAISEYNFYFKQYLSHMRSYNVRELLGLASYSWFYTGPKFHKLMKGKRYVSVSTINVQTLQKSYKIPELINSAIVSKHDIVCVQEHRYYHPEVEIKEHDHSGWKLLTASAWKNTVNATIGGVGLFIRSSAYQSLLNIEKISSRIIISTFDGNPKTSVICCYSPTNVSEESEVEKFYYDLASVVRQIPKHNFLIIAGDFNSQIGKSSSTKFTFHDISNRNGNFLKEFIDCC